MSVWYLLSVYVHIIAASLWVGGMLFFIIVLLPAIKKHPDKAILLHQTGLKFRFAGWITLITLLITGLFNMHQRSIGLTWNDLSESTYGQLVGAKIIIFLIVIVVSAIHDFHVGTKATEKWISNENEAEIERFRKMARWVGRLNFLLAMAAVGLGVIIVRGWI